MSSPLILSLESCADSHLVGGKATALGRLMQYGFNVPKGFCLTTAAYRAALQACGVDPDERWLAVAQAAESERTRMLVEYRTSILKGRMPADVQVAVQAMLNGMKTAPHNRLWAVRSSATQEDGAKASFAGLYETTLGVSALDLVPAIHHCWASLWTEPVFNYHLQLGLSRAIPTMAVIIQPMIAARAAGVAYSSHPIDERRDEIMINAVHGLATSLVKGNVTPDSYVVHVDETSGVGTIRERDVARRQIATRLTSEGVTDEPLSEVDTQPAINDGEAVTLASLVKKVGKAFGQPVDVEWAMDQEGLWLLQARPIVRAKSSKGITHESSVWSRANFKETLPEVPSPLGLSFLAQFMERNILAHYRRLGCVIPLDLSSVQIVRGRPYINVTLFQSFMAQLGGDPELVSEQMGGEGGTVRNETNRLAWWKLIRAGFLMMWTMSQAATRAPAWFADLRQMGRVQTQDVVPERSPAEIFRQLDRLGQRLHQRDLTFAIVGGVGQSLQALNFLLERWIGEGWRGLLNAALQGQGNVISAKQILRLAEMAEKARTDPKAHAFLIAEPWMPERFRERLSGTPFVEELDAYLAEYGHRGIGESDVMSPRFSEQPAYILGVIRAHLQAPPNKPVTQGSQEQESRRHAALCEIRRAYGWRLDRWIIFLWWYRRLCRYLALREANRHHVMYFSSAVRRLVLRMGETLVTQGVITTSEDLFFLTIEEIRTLVSGSNQDWKGIVAARRAEQEDNQRHQVPDTIQARMSQERLKAQAERIGDGSLSGIPISAGHAEGPVCVVQSSDDLKKVKRGDILVTPVIDPGMAPFFGVAAGLIVEMGGTLSHGAIIAREYGLPAVANVPGITRLLKDGERVVVEATRGKIYRMDMRPPS
ncbi:MAG: PEP/pyruvate-binding domain-containing protein [Nitrospiraceae bacterium]